MRLLAIFKHCAQLSFSFADDDVLWEVFTQCAMLRFYNRWKIGIRPKMSSEDTFHFHTFCSPWASPFFEKDKRRKSKSIEEQFLGCWRFWEFKRTTTFSLITIYCGRTELINDVRKSFSNDDLWTEIWRWWSFLQAKKEVVQSGPSFFYHQTPSLYHIVWKLLKISHMNFSILAYVW